LDVSSDAERLGEDGEEDGVRRSTANPMVGVVRWIASWRGARAPPELADAAASKRAIWQPGGVELMQFVGEKRGGRGLFKGGRDLREGLGFWARGCGSDDAGGRCDRAGHWCEEDADRWAPPVSGWASARRIVSGAGGSWAGPASWPGPKRSLAASVPIFLFFPFSFSVFLFSFVTYAN
jgi:hypothetical protein